MVFLYIIIIAMASKLSLFVVSFCTIFDLFTAINFGYRVFAASVIYICYGQSYFYRIFLLLPALGSGVLYFGFDVQMLTRVLITQFNNNGVNLGMQNPNFKKIFIIYYIFFCKYLCNCSFILLRVCFIKSILCILMVVCHDNLYVYFITTDYQKCQIWKWW